MEFSELAAVIALAGAVLTMTMRVLMDAVEIRSGRAGEINLQRNKKVLLGMSLVAGGSLLILGQPWLVAAAATMPGTAACAVMVEMSEQAREKEKTE